MDTKGDRDHTEVYIDGCALIHAPCVTDMQVGCEVNQMWVIEYVQYVYTIYMLSNVVICRVVRLRFSQWGDTGES